LLKKKGQKINDEPIKPVRIRRVSPDNSHHKKEESKQSGSFLFSYRLIPRVNRIRTQAKELIVLKEGVE